MESGDFSRVHEALRRERRSGIIGKSQKMQIRNIKALFFIQFLFFFDQM